MNYNEIIYTHPIPCVAGHTEELKVNKGDSYFITLKECSAPTSWERTYLEAGWGVVNEYTLPETPIGIGNVFSGLVMFRYPDSGANPIDRPPALTIQCEDGILPAIEIEMHVLEWKE